MIFAYSTADFICFMTKLTTFISIGFFVLLLQCENTSHPETSSKQAILRSSTGIKNNVSKYNSGMVIEPVTNDKINQWTSFFVLKDEIENLNSNNYSIFDQNAAGISTVFDNLNIGIPEVFDTNTIWARFKVLETNVFLYSNATHNKTPEQLDFYKKNILIAYNNLILQINKNKKKSTQIEFN